MYRPATGPGSFFHWASTWRIVPPDTFCGRSQKGSESFIAVCGKGVQPRSDSNSMNGLIKRASVPNPTPLLFLMAGTVAWCLVWIEDPGSPWLLLVLLLAAFILLPA